MGRWLGLLVLVALVFVLGRLGVGEELLWVALALWLLMPLFRRGGPPPGGG